MDSKLTSKQLRNMLQDLKYLEMKYDINFSYQSYISQLSKTPSEVPSHVRYSQQHKDDTKNGPPGDNTSQHLNHVVIVNQASKRRQTDLNFVKLRKKFRQPSPEKTQPKESGLQIHSIVFNDKPKTIWSEAASNKSSTSSGDQTKSEEDTQMKNRELILRPIKQKQMDVINSIK